MTSLKDLQEDFAKIKPQQEEILRLLKEQQACIEAAAAKIINELKTIIQSCPCHKNILQVKEERPKEIIHKDDKTPNPEKGNNWKYSYPNYNVGNEELGSGKNPNSLTWPFGVDPKPQ